MFASLLVLAALARPARAANDPRLLWQTIETAHFRINFYSGERAAAEHIADLAEGIYSRLTPVMAWAPRAKTEIALTDQTDSANGSATALPYNHVRLYMTAPEDLSPLGDVDDWFLELLTHEFTHILQTDHIRGLPALANAVIGKTFAPNQAAPRWLLEGLAILEESAQTSGGRLRSSQWSMYMRTDVLEGNVATLDQVSNSPRRWPQGNLWYLYGSYFLRYVADTYGDEALRRMVRETSFQIVPWGVNRMIRRATGRTFEEMYPAWVASMRQRFEAQAAAVQARGLREGTRITYSGQTAMYPRFIPENTWPGHGGEVLYYRDDGHSLTGLYRVPLKRDARGVVTGGGAPELMVRTAGSSSASFLPDGDLIFDSVDTLNNLFAFNELHRLPRDTRSPWGIDGTRTRLTVGWRASQADVAPDGTRVAFVTNHRGTSYLQVSALAPGGASLEWPRNLVPGQRLDQAFAPRWSPDNRHLAYSVWQKGGYRDLRVVDTFDGSYVQVTHDRAIDGGPSWSPDGKRVYFHSDRTGIMNVYAYDVATGALAQVTNVVNGAYQPVVSADGRTLVYLGYTHQGFDLFAMPLDVERFLPALPYSDDRPPAPQDPPRGPYQVKPYNPLRTLSPRAYSVRTGPGNFGQYIGVSTSGSDIAGLHSFDASLTAELERPELQPDVRYAYGRLPVDMSLRLSRSISPRGGFALGRDYRPPWILEALVAEARLNYSLPRAFEGQSVSMGYTAARTGGELPLSPSKLDPYEMPTFPQRGFLTLLTLSWSYSNAQRFLWSVAAEKGWSASATVSISHPALASQYRAYSAVAALSVAETMPWLRHHSVALNASGGTTGGSYPGQSAFYVGGFVDVPFVKTVRYSLIQGGMVLRGYPVVALQGRSMALFNAEYRFPILNVDRGLSTLPIFFNRVTGNVFVDYGSAFDDAAAAQFKTGVGGELWFDLAFGYFIGLTFRAGYARGLASGGVDKTYFTAAVPF